jgi:hypothetical protein
MTDDVVNDFLEHHGVKGMKWGVRNEDDTSDGLSDVQKDLKAHPTKKLSPEEKKQLRINQKKHDSHFDPSEEEPPKKGWRPTKKQAVLIGVGTVVAAGIVAGAVYKVKTGGKVPSFSEADYLNSIRSAETPGWIKNYSGHHMSPTDYKGIIGNSCGRVWTGEHLTKESFAQKEIIYEKGHQFWRISRKKESTFRDSTYALSNEADFARYVNTFAMAADRDAQLISFKANDTVKIPDLHTTLNAMHSVLVKEGKTKVKPAEVVTHFTNMSGGGYSSPRSKNFINELVSKGYHGIVDQMDAGVYGEVPLVLFDKTRLGQKSATPLQSLDLKKYEKMLVDIPNRR